MTKEKKNLFISDKPLYDYNIEYDSSHLPSYLKELIEELEEYDKVGDWVSYDCTFDVLEIKAKEHFRNNRVTEYDFKTILKKYRGIYD